MLISEIDDGKERMNSMGNSQTNTQVVEKLTAVLATVTALAAVSATPDSVSDRNARAASASPRAVRSPSQIIQAPPIDLSGIVQSLKSLNVFVKGVELISDDDKASVLMRALITSDK